MGSGKHGGEKRTRKPGGKGVVHVDKFGKGFADRVKAARRKPGNTWHLDEMFVTLRGEPYLLWRAVDEHGVELDILVQKRRDKAAAKRFFEGSVAVRRSAILRT